MSSVLIRNGLVIDGTGTMAFPADVLVVNALKEQQIV